MKKEASAPKRPTHPGGLFSFLHVIFSQALSGWILFRAERARILW